MTKKKVRAVGAAVLAALWLTLTVFAWFGPKKEMSEAERRPLEQMPAFNGGALLSGKFMENFEDYSLDQFPLRDTFRSLKSLFHYYVLGQKDNNGIYLADGYAAKLEYPLNQSSVDHAIKRFQNVYDSYLADTGSKILFSVVPDKGYYLGQENGYPVMDYEALFSQLEEELPWAEFVDLTDKLNVQSYYRTDTHWRQEQLLPVAQALCEALGVTQPEAEDYTVTQLNRPFYGVYYGQAALPMEPESISILESRLLSDCTVYNYEDLSTTQVYDMQKLTSRDLYEVYLSGPRSLLRIDNPNAKTDRELIVFRDSFGSSMAPLLVQDYRSVTLVDIRYLSSSQLGKYLEFNGQDVLFLYSTLLLNSSVTLK